MTPIPAPILLPVADPGDPRVADYLQVRERDLVGRAGRFVAEGEVVVRVLLRQARFETLSLLAAEGRAETVRRLLEGSGFRGPVYLAAQAVMDAIVGFPIHRGLLAIGRRREPADPAALLAALPDRALVAVLVGLANHDNVGGVFRNAAAFGVDAVLLDGATCDPLYRKALRVSVGSSLLVPFARAADPGVLLDALAGSGFTVLALSPAGRETLSGLSRPPRTALVLGAEGPGLPAGILARTRTVRIPMAGGFDSLNVATTSGIAFHSLAGLA